MKNIYKINYKKEIIGGSNSQISDKDLKKTELSIYNDKHINYMEPSKTSLYLIERGTILYHGSMSKGQFNPYDIRLGDDRLAAYFSPNKRLAADYIVGCALFPTKAGYLHKFRVKKDIAKILIISAYERQEHKSINLRLGT